MRQPGTDGHHAWMSIIIKFFMAPDNAAATGVLDSGPEGVLESLILGNFDVHGATIEWESILTGRSFEELVSMDEPRIVAEADSGSLVFAVSSALRDGLGAADDALLNDLAIEWSRREAEKGSEFELDVARLILGEVADLARSTSRRGYDLYCWMT
jgi:hypothetical protein